VLIYQRGCPRSSASDIDDDSTDAEKVAVIKAKYADVD
jgi:hypothetical protein